jgi:hypothetical protein
MGEPVVIDDATQLVGEGDDPPSPVEAVGLVSSGAPGPCMTPSRLTKV